MKTRYEKTIVGRNHDYRRVDAFQKIDGEWENVAYASVPVSGEGREFVGGRSNSEIAICLRKAQQNRRCKSDRVSLSDGTR